jgi:hypothetical protein
MSDMNLTILSFTNRDAIADVMAAIRRRQVRRQRQRTLRGLMPRIG